MSVTVPPVPAVETTNVLHIALLSALPAVQSALAELSEKFAQVRDADKAAERAVFASPEDGGSSDPAVVAFRAADAKLAAQIDKLTAQRAAQKTAILDAVRKATVGDLDATALSAEYSATYETAKNLAGALKDVPEVQVWFANVPTRAKQTGRVVKDGEAKRPREVSWTPPLTDATIDGESVEFPNGKATFGNLAKIVATKLGVKDISRAWLVTQLLHVVGHQDAFKADTDYSFTLTVNGSQHTITVRADKDRIVKRGRAAKSESSESAAA